MTIADLTAQLGVGVPYTADDADSDEDEDEEEGFEGLAEGSSYSVRSAPLEQLLAEVGYSYTKSAVSVSTMGGMGGTNTNTSTSTIGNSNNIVSNNRRVQVFVRTLHRLCALREKTEQALLASSVSISVSVSEIGPPVTCDGGQAGGGGAEEWAVVEELLLPWLPLLQSHRVDVEQGQGQGTGIGPGTGYGQGHGKGLSMSMSVDVEQGQGQGGNNNGSGSGNTNTNTNTNRSRSLSSFSDHILARKKSQSFSIVDVDPFLSSTMKGTIGGSSRRAPSAGDDNDQDHDQLPYLPSAVRPAILEEIEAICRCAVRVHLQPHVRRYVYVYVYV